MTTEEHHIVTESGESAEHVAAVVATEVGDAHEEVLDTATDLIRLLQDRVCTLESRLDAVHAQGVIDSHRDADRVAEVLNTATVADAIHHEETPVATVVDEPGEAVTELGGAIEEAEDKAEKVVEKAEKVEKSAPARKHRLYGKR